MTVVQEPQRFFGTILGNSHLLKTTDKSFVKLFSKYVSGIGESVKIKLLQEYNFTNQRKKVFFVSN